MPPIRALFLAAVLALVDPGVSQGGEPVGEIVDEGRAGDERQAVQVGVARDGVLFRVQPVPSGLSCTPYLAQS